MGAADEHDPLCIKCREFESILDRYRDMARTLPVDRLLRQLYRETCMLAYAGSGKEHRDRNAIRTRRTNLLRFYEYARRFESGSFKGLYQFISYVSGIIEEGTKIEFGGSAASDAVSIMTIHKSKGLEFPVCFVCGAGGYFNQSDVKNTLLFDRDMGLAIRIPDQTGFARLNTPMRLAIIARQNEQLREEEIRLLYVAMTRARERLYLTGKSRSSAAKLEEAAYLRTAFGSDHRVALMDCHSYLEWTLAALSTGRGEDCFTLRMLTPAQVDEYEQQIKERCQPTSATDETEDATRILSEIDPADMQMWRDRFAFRYPHEHLTTLPSKISVSDLHPGVLDEQLNIEAEDARFAEEDAQLRLQISGRVLDHDTDSMIEKWLSRTPAFCQPEAEQKISAAERGTATHLFLQFCDMENARRHGVRAEAVRLTEERFLPPYVAERIREEQLTRFFGSDFYESLRHARRVWREQRFQLLLPADRFTENKDYARELSGEVLLVQGVIDLFFETEDGRLILCDYKTDALSAEERRNPTLAQKKLSERHGRQLAYYAEALVQLCGRKPDEVVIYSLPLGDTVQIHV
jgi:ATP-dependent helicase/nuclease subunit A